jgi:hypothetical protein
MVFMMSSNKEKTMKHAATVFETEISQLAIRVAQYITKEVTGCKASIQVESDVYVVRVHSPFKMTKQGILSLRATADGIKWQFNHSHDLVSPLNDFYMGDI